MYLFIFHLFLAKGDSGNIHNQTKICTAPKIYKWQPEVQKNEDKAQTHYCQPKILRNHLLTNVIPKVNII